MITFFHHYSSLIGKPLIFACPIIYFRLFPERNLSRQREIDLEISDLQLSNLAATKNKNQHKIISRKPLSIFASPYFKDKHLYHPPPNEDTRRKGLNKELNVWIDYPIPFKEEERRKLKIYVKEDAVKKKSLRLRQEKEKIEAKLNSFIFDEEVSDKSIPVKTLTITNDMVILFN